MKKLLPFLIGVAVLYWIARPYVDFTFNLLFLNSTIFPYAHKLLLGGGLTRWQICF